MKKSMFKSLTGRLVILVLMLSMIFTTGVFAAVDVNSNDSADGTAIDTQATTDIGVQYRGHVQNKGDVPLPVGSFVTGPDELGSRGEGLRLEGLRIELTGDIPAGAGISYDVHVQNKGWQGPVSNGAYAGTTAQGLRIEAIKINLTGLDGYEVYYRGHVQNKGDIPVVDESWGWVKNGAQLGTTGESLRLESIQIKIVKTENYTALGDSIAYGMSATPGSGYVNLFYNHLTSQTGNENLQLVNLGVPGYTSSQLLNQLQNDPATMAALSQAKVITISVGGNNILAPVIAGLAVAFQLDPNSPTFPADLATALAQPGAADIITAALPEIQTSVTASVTQFGTDWPQIVATVKTLAPQADIYVTTLYDPINLQDPLYAVFDPAIQTINTAIKTPVAGYKVADVYTAFATYEGSEPLVNFNWYTGNLDPHPTTAGHQQIYQCHLNASLIN
ncbi:GDSL-type esterase/lipase family protein [Acetobacterium wieringae]|uniref:GDSL-type esterase/lipase family protein n=1 Tax=Acetobacterium wieringae TaxID=52694 RepID=UPI0031581DF9